MRVFRKPVSRLTLGAVIALFSSPLIMACNASQSAEIKPIAQKKDTSFNPAAPGDTTVAIGTTRAAIDTALYDRKTLFLAKNDSSSRFWIRKDYPLAGAILPFNRVVAYYGNLYSKRMGALGEYPRKEMEQRLMAEVKKWRLADTATPAIPALHYICVTAQGAAGKDGKYRARMPFSQIDSILSMAKDINALVFLDVQVAQSTLQAEIPLLEKYLSMPNVHLGIDPEFSMKTGKKPGSVIGTFDAADVNYTADYLTKLVKAHNLPPKILIVHRFTRAMVTNYKNVRLRPEVQFVVDMDGWGSGARKFSTYESFIAPEPIQFTGFKLFYKNDLKEDGKMLTPEQVLKLKPMPIYIQYQ